MRSIPSELFEPAPTTPALPDDQVHVWLLAVDDPPDHRAVARAVHSLLGRLLANYGGLPDPPLIARTGRGKPYAPALPGLDFNLSHARDHALIAIARAQPLGVDLERIDRKLDAHELARRFFSKREADALGAVPEAQRGTAFLRLWTCKEAVLKALGAGISFGLDRVAFDLDAGGMPVALAEVAPEAGEASDWQVSLLEPAPGFLGALAWHGAPRQVRTFVAGGDLVVPHA